MGLKLPEIRVVNRSTGLEETEKVFGERALALLYNGGIWEKIVGFPLRLLLSRTALFSKTYGWIQRRPRSRKKISKFVATFDVDASEFVKPIEAFSSFDDFFIRKLKPESRPIAPGDNVAIVPADGRFWACPRVAHADSFLIKGYRYTLSELLDDPILASQYEYGSLLMGRLCPSDYHRFHFPIHGTPGEARLIKGRLASVNPVAIRKWFDTFTRNKRMVTIMTTPAFGKVIIIEIGATAVGTIHQTYIPHVPAYKGQEKGFFSFGGSAVIILFEPGSILFSEDLLYYSQKFMEVRCQVGQILGTARRQVDP